MLDEQGRQVWCDHLERHVEDALEFYAANSVKIPSHETFAVTVNYEYRGFNGYRGSRWVGKDTRVGYLHFSLFVDDDMVDNAVSMWLHCDQDRFAFALEDIRVW